MKGDDITQSAQDVDTLLWRAKYGVPNPEPFKIISSRGIFSSRIFFTWKKMKNLTVFRTWKKAYTSWCFHVAVFECHIINNSLNLDPYSSSSYTAPCNQNLIEKLLAISKFLLSWTTFYMVNALREVFVMMDAKNSSLKRIRDVVWILDTMTVNT